MEIEIKSTGGSVTDDLKSTIIENIEKINSELEEVDK